MLSVYAVCAVTANPNSWSSSTDFRHGGSRFQLHPVMFSTLLKHLSFWPTWQVMLLLDQRDWGKPARGITWDNCVLINEHAHTRWAEYLTARQYKIQTPHLNVWRFYLSIYSDISFKSFGFILIDTICGCLNHFFWWFLLLCCYLVFLVSYGKNIRGFGGKTWQNKTTWKT
jgi:hypothetical protein